jgi:hypothetical protein
MFMDTKAQYGQDIFPIWSVYSMQSQLDPSKLFCGDWQTDSKGKAKDSEQPTQY